MLSFRAVWGLVVALLLANLATSAVAQVATLPRVNTPTTPPTQGISTTGVVLVDQAGIEKATQSSPLLVSGRGGTAIATGQVSASTAATQIVGARPGRQKVILSVGAANACAFGGSAVTASTGFPLQPVAGAAVSLDTSAAIYAACAATTTIAFLEQF